MANRADDNGPFKEFRFDEWLRGGFEGMCGPHVKFKKVHLDTSEFETHMRNAAKEQLLAVRSLVDSFIDMVESKEPGQETPQSRQT